MILFFGAWIGMIIGVGIGAQLPKPETVSVCLKDNKQDCFEVQAK